MSTVLVAHNLRSAHNVGSLLRTAEGLGVDKVFLTGYTPYPAISNDSRMPHLTASIHKKISKTALGAEESLDWEHAENIGPLINSLKDRGYLVVALEQNSKSVELQHFKPPKNIALIVGREVEGIEPEILNMVDRILEIPMAGKKESFNVAIAAAMALYHIRFGNL